MKKVLSFLLTLCLGFTLTACSSSSSGDKDSGSSDASSAVDFSKYPSSLNEWTGQNFIDYFKEYGLFTDGNGAETWVQDHANYWPGTPVKEAAGWWDDAGTFLVMVLIHDETLPDTSKADYDAWMSQLKDKHMMTEDFGSMPVDHLAGNVGFTFETTVTDDEIYSKTLQAYNDLLAALKVKAEY